MFRWICLLLLASFFGWANQTSTDFKEYKEFAKSLNGAGQQAIDEFNPQSVFEQYSEQPKEQSYYQGEEQEHTDLSAQASQAIQNEPGAQIIVQEFGKNKFEINSSSSVLTDSQLIQDESYAITHGQSNDKVTCDEQKPVCERKSHEEVCFQSRQLPDEECTKQLKVLVDSEKLAQRADFTFVVPKKWTGSITVNLTTGAMTNVISGSLSHPIRMNHACSQMNASIHSITNNAQNAYWVSVIGNPSCANQGTVTLQVNKSWAREYPIQVALTVIANSKPYIAQEYWESYCGDFEQKADLCHIKTQACTEKKSTKNIDGVEVTRDCWAEKIIYSCSSSKADECLTQKNKGCLQIGSQCVRMEKNYCALYQQTYHCDEEVCQNPVVCVRDLFCADGECTEHLQTQNKEFGQSVSSLAVVGEEGETQKSQPGALLFGGTAVQCKIWPINMIDCCHDKGWGKDIDLLHCRDEDKALGEAKLNYVAHYVGEFCSEEVAGVCMEHKRTYCVFPSKMARIIQEARLSQLGAMSLGNPQSPNCAGVTLEQLQQMDLGQVDFVHPIYPYPGGSPNMDAGIAAEMSIKNKEANQTIDEITRRIQKNVEAQS